MAGSVSLPTLSGGGGIWADEAGRKDQASLGPPQLVARWEKVPVIVFWGGGGALISWSDGAKGNLETSLQRFVTPFPLNKTGSLCLNLLSAHLLRLPQ